MFEIEHAAEKVLHFIRTEDDRQLLWLLGKREDLFRQPVPRKRNMEEKAQRRNGDVDRAGRQLLLVGQIDLIGPNIFAAEQVRRLAEVSCKQRHLLQIRELGIERKMRTCMSSLMRWRSGVMTSSSVRWNRLQTAVSSSRSWGSY